MSNYASRQHPHIDDSFDEDLPPSGDATSTLDLTQLAISAHANQPHPYQTSAERTAALTAELTSLQSINASLDELINTFSSAQGHVNALNNTVVNSTQLLDLWSRIMSQTEHNSRLILDPNWQGARQDANDDAAEEKAREEREERRKEERKRAKEEEDARRERMVLEQSLKSSMRGGRGRGRGTSRGGLAPSRGVPGTSTRGVSRGRATTTTRGRGT